MNARYIWRLVKESVAAWIDDYAPSMGAALAYYTAFSIAPLLLIVIGIAGIVFGAEAAQGGIVAQLEGLIGREAGIAVQGLLKSASEPAHGVVATIVGAITLVIGATTVFGELQSALDRIWEVPAAKKPSGIWSLLRQRLLSFGMVLVLGFLMLVSLLLSAALAALGTWWGGFFDGWEAALQVINFVVSFALVTGLFAAIYKMMPRARIAWRDVWIGAVVTALLFTVGKFLIGLYLGKSGVTSSFGAAGSLVVLLIWVYYSAQVFLLGAEFTWVYAHQRGSRTSASRTDPAGPELPPTAEQTPWQAGPTARKGVPAVAPEAQPGILPMARLAAGHFPSRDVPKAPAFGARHPVRNLGILVASGLILGGMLRHLAPPGRLSRAVQGLGSALRRPGRMTPKTVLARLAGK